MSLRTQPNLIGLVEDAGEGQPGRGWHDASDAIDVCGATSAADNADDPCRNYHAWGGPRPTPVPSPHLCVGNPPTAVNSVGGPATSPAGSRLRVYRISA